MDKSHCSLLIHFIAARRFQSCRVTLKMFSSTPDPTPPFPAILKKDRQIAEGPAQTTSLDTERLCRSVEITGDMLNYSESHGVMVSTQDSPHNDPGSIPSLGGAVGIWVYYPCGSATSSARDVKQGCRLCTHAFKIMHRR